MDLIANSIRYAFGFAIGAILGLIATILNYADVILIVLILFAIISYIGKKILQRRNEKEFYEAQQEAERLEAEMKYMAEEYDWSKEP